MASLPDNVKKAWEKRAEPFVFTTVDENGMPNSIYVVCVKWYDDKIVIADNKFQKTKQNIHAGCKGTLLFITKEEKAKAYQVKGSLEYQQSGALYDEMKQEWLDSKFPGNGATVLNVEEVYSGAEKLL